MDQAKLPQLETLSDLIWIQTSFLGDIVLQTAALDFVRKRYPLLRQHLITTPLGAKALAKHPSLDSLVVFDKRGLSMRQAIRNVRHELRHCHRSSTVILQAHRSARSSLLAFALGLPRVTYEETRLAWLAHRRVSRVAVLHETLRLGLLLEALGARREDLAGILPSLPVHKSPLLEASLQKYGQARLLGIAPGSVWATKRWPVEYFIELGRELLKSSDVVLVILGSQDEQATAATLEQGLGTDKNRCLNLAGKTSLDDLRALYPRLSLLISNDSSPLHYASAFQVPTLAIFGATVPAMGFGPRSALSRVAQIDLACRPCSDHGPMRCPLGHFDCMKKLQPALVGRMALEILSEIV
ncbi:MAG: glycosyltransferase family 9 protein [Proteobacteria bacterium]|nr:glycosyltransferase family 9 protein [Pseudomonadota bacterium]